METGNAGLLAAAFMILMPYGASALTYPVVDTGQSWTVSATEEVY